MGHPPVSSHWKIRWGYYINLKQDGGFPSCKWDESEYYSINIHRYGGVLKWGYPQSSSILVRFSIRNHPFWGSPIYGNPHMEVSWVMGVPPVIIYFFHRICSCENSKSIARSFPWNWMFRIGVAVYLQFNVCQGRAHMINICWNIQPQIDF